MRTLDYESMGNCDTWIELLPFDYAVYKHDFPVFLGGGGGEKKGDEVSEWVCWTNTHFKIEIRLGKLKKS